MPDNGMLRINGAQCRWVAHAVLKYGVRFFGGELLAVEEFNVAADDNHEAIRGSVDAPRQLIRRRY